MTRHRTHLDTASGSAITPITTNCNTVMRISALSEGEFEKAAFGLKILRQVAFMLPAKSKTPKRLAASQVADASGVTRALQSLVGWQCRNTVFECHNYNNRPRKAVGAKFDPLYGWLVNEAESADRLIRLHCSV